MTEEYSSKDLDHLGIVSVMCDSEIISSISQEDMQGLAEGYKCAEVCSMYGKVQQRWL